MESALSADRQRLTELMEYSCDKQDSTWEQVAQRGGRSVALLRNIRNGSAPLTRKSKRAIERGLGWPEGAVDGVLTNDPQAIEIIKRIGPDGFIAPPADLESGSREWWEDIVRRTVQLPPDKRGRVIDALKRALAREGESAR